MKVTGKIKMVGETQTFGSNGFTKREFVVTTTEQYPQDLLIEFHQDKCDLLNGFKVGEGAEVSINLRGREWVNPQGEVKYFNTLQGWKIEKQHAANPEPNDAPFKTIPADQTNEETDDLPF